jgi:hypothetical protein
MDPSIDYKAVADILHRVRTDRQIKLQFGATKRAELKVALDRGQVPDHYRIKWLFQTRNELAAWLSAKAKEFNSQFPQDACSVPDLIDVAVSTVLLLKQINRSDV